jgi:hypothetical protein
MPALLLDERAGEFEDRMDFDVKYPLATAKKALIDWLYLGESDYSKIAGPPLDLEFGHLDTSRLSRLARSMGLAEDWKAWRARNRKHDSDPGVRGTVRTTWRCGRAAATTLGRDNSTLPGIRLTFLLSRYICLRSRT